MNTLLFKHPTTVSGVAVDGRFIATSCFDGNVRVFNPSVSSNPVISEHRASQLNCVAMRGGIVVSDDATSTLKEGVAITMDLSPVHPVDFNPPTGVRILSIDKWGRYGVGTDLLCRDRHSGQSWRVLPVGAGFDRWPMGVEENSSGDVVTVDLGGNISVWTDQALLLRRNLTPEGLSSVDVALDGRIVVTDWKYGIHVLSGTLTVLLTAKEATLIHQARWLPDGRIVYGTADGRLVIWDGISAIQLPPTAPASVAKPGKGKRGTVALTL